MLTADRMSPSISPITVPYGDTDRAEKISSEWRRQGGEGTTPVPSLTLPRRTDGSYTVHMRMKNMAGLVFQDMYSDEIAGHCEWDGRAMAVFQLRGRSRLSVARQMKDVSAGLVCATRSESAWDWETGSGTRVAILSLPAREVRFPKAQRSVTAERESPAARMLLAHLHTWADLDGELSPAAQWSARNAALELFHGLLNDQVIDDEQFSATLVRAATEWIDGRLADRDLDPRAVADSLFVSTRSLHRAFASQSTSVMGYVRDRRLERQVGTDDDLADHVATRRPVALLRR
jgi:hypothetical protein